MDDIPRSIIILIILIIAAAFFAAAETAFSYCNSVRIRLLAEQGDKRAARTVWIIDRYERTVVTLLIAINILHVVAASIATVTAEDILKNNSIAPVVATAVLTVAVFLFGENIPKNFARTNADAFCLATSFVVRCVIFVFWPFATLLMWIGDGIKKLMKIKNTEPTLTEDEFAEIVDSAGDDGLIEPEETEIIKSAVEFGDLTVAEVMTGRENISAIPANVSVEKLKAILLEEKYSRFPVYDGNIDHIVGVLQATGCLWQLINSTRFRMRDAVSKPYFVTPEMSVEEVFRGMGRRRGHFAVVRDKDGITVGIITMEDILEEIVGEIYDEDDEAAPAEDSTEKENGNAPGTEALS